VNFAALEGLVLSVTLAPEDPAGLFRVTVTVGLPTPPRAELVLILIPVMAGGRSLSVVVLVTVPSLAVTVRVVATLTPFVVSVKAPLELPLATKTLDVDKEAKLEFEIVRATFAPTEGARPFRDTVPVIRVPAEADVELRPTLLNETGFRVRVAVFDRPPALTPITTLVLAATPKVVTAKDAELLPDATVIVSGTVAADGFPEVRETTTPLLGAGLSRLTVPITPDGLPPTTEVGDRLNVVGWWDVTVRFPDAELAPTDAVIVTVVDCETPVVVILNWPVVEPAAIVTVAGTVVDGSEEVTPRLTPPEGAGAARETVPVTVDELPPSIVVGLTETLFIETTLSSRATNPAKMIGPQPLSVSHPFVAIDVAPFGSVPFVPEVMS
jgi:hypothetical protein